VNFRVDNFQDKVLIHIVMVQFTKGVLKEVNQKDTGSTNLLTVIYMLVNLKQIHFTDKELLLTALVENTKENLQKVYIMDKGPSHFQMEGKIAGDG